jgi:hypothetical protein
MIATVASGLMVSLAVWNGYRCILCSNRVSEFTSIKIRVVLIARILISAALIFGASAVV